MNGLLQAIPNEDDTFVFVESTARGMSGPFYDAWKAAVSETSGYLAYFAPWFEDDKYRAQVPQGIKRTPDEEEYFADRKSVGEGKSVSVRVDIGGSRIFKKKITETMYKK